MGADRPAVQVEVNAASPSPARTASWVASRPPSGGPWGGALRWADDDWDNHYWNGTYWSGTYWSGTYWSGDRWAGDNWSKVNGT